MSIAPEEGGATLNDTYELLKRELALEGNVSDVVAQACRALGVSPEGSIMDRAARCRAALLGGGSRPQPCRSARHHLGNGGSRRGPGARRRGA